MHLAPELRPLVHTDAALRDAALMLLREENSDLIFVDNHGLRLIHQAMRSQIYLTDRYPSPSQYCGLGYVDLDDCISLLLTSGYYLVRCRPLSFNSEHWVGFLTNPGQVVAKEIKQVYTSPLLPLLKIANLTLQQRIELALYSVANAGRST